MHDDGGGADPYGAWPSPISAELVARAGVDFGHVTLADGTAYWREERPDEDGRGVVVRDGDGTTEDVTPEGVDVGTRVHEYGGGDFAVRGDTVFFARDDDQRVYRQRPGDDPVPITPDPETERGLRYADFEPTSDGGSLFCVRENHDATAEDDVDEPVTELVRIRTDGDEPPRAVASGHDFYAAPRLSPDGDELAWLAWDHPRMPWDGTELYVADVRSDGTFANERVVMGGPDESVFQPAWHPDGTLYAVSDRTGWWNLYRRDGDEWLPCREERAEYGVPQWTFGLSTFAFLADGRIATIVGRDGERVLEILGDGEPERVDLGYATYAPQLVSDGESVVVLASGPATPWSVVRWTPGEGHEVLRRGAEVDVDEAYFSHPEHVTYGTRDGAESHAFVYPPRNPDAEPPEDDAPPVIVVAHGGPTGSTRPDFDLGIQFFTSRGFAVADVNYRGSAGYGRAYRDALYDEWGRIDVTDCLDAARHLGDAGRVDPDRVAVRGGSAGGFVVLSALSFHDDVDAGASYYGVADLSKLAELTHKFESHYLDQLVGPYPEAAKTYRERSPVHHADGIDAPVLLLQGEDDAVVPLSQAEAMVDALEADGVPHDLVVFEDERHGFRRADSRRRALEREFAFYGEVFGFEPTDDLPSLELSPGGES